MSPSGKYSLLNSVFTPVVPLVLVEAKAVGWAAYFALEHVVGWGLRPVRGPDCGLVGIAESAHTSTAAVFSNGGVERKYFNDRVLAVTASFTETHTVEVIADPVAKSGKLLAHGLGWQRESGRCEAPAALLVAVAVPWLECIVSPSPRASSPNT